MSKLTNVLVLLPLDEEQRARLEAGAPDARYAYVSKRYITDGQLAEADAIVGNLPPERLGTAVRLRLLQLNSAGYDKYANAEGLAAAAALCSASGAYGQAVSEHLFAMLLALLKNLPAYHDDQRAHVWGDHGASHTLVGARVVVLGTGDIGTHFARLAQAMGARVWGVRRHPGEAFGPFEAVRTMEELPGLLPDADVVASFLPSAPSTRGLVDAAFLAAMREGSYLVNGGRGDLVDETALVAALEDGHLAGAALDVTSPEPLQAESPLWDAPNALVTPHVSGGFHLPATLDNIVAIAAENLRRVEADEEPRNLVRR